jgi:nucleotide-binding universal stress UspA family protein
VLVSKNPHSAVVRAVLDQTGSDAKGDAFMFTRILVPTDFNAPSDAALEYAKVLAGQFGASLHVLHVVGELFATAPAGSEVYIADSPDFVTRVFEDAKVRLSHRVTAIERVRYRATTEIVTGATARSIVNYASERGMDLIVMGTHGRSGLDHLLMGSVAERVIRHAACPVMTVRHYPVEDVRLVEGLGESMVAHR